MLSPDKVVKIVLAKIKEFYTAETFIGGENDNVETIQGSFTDEAINGIKLTENKSSSEMKSTICNDTENDT